MNEDKTIKLNMIILGVAAVFFGFLYLFYSSYFGSDKNIANENQITRDEDWKNNKSFYSGSELGFNLSNSDNVSFEFKTDSDATQGVEIIVNDERYILNSPLLTKQKLSLSIDKHKTNKITIRHFCTYYYHPCKIELKGIWVDRDSKINPYELHNKRLSVLGDSISTNYGNKNYSYLLASTLGYELHNASILGSTLTSKNTANSLTGRYKKNIKDFPSDVVIIFIGSNDVEISSPLSNFKSDYLRMVKNIKMWHPKATVFLVGIFQRKDIDVQKIYEYNQIITAVASESNVQFIDTTDWLDENDYSDDIHPSIGSQEKISQQFLSEIKKFVK